MKYTMSQVTQLTGIQAHTLRVWERRYDFIKAKRKESKFRYYTEEQLKILLKTSILLQNGFRISTIANLELDEINWEVEAVFNQSTEIESDKIQALVLAMLNFDEALFNRIFDQTVESIGVLEGFTKVFYPFLNLLGGMWVYNKANPAHEHFISNLIRQKLIALTDILASPKDNAQTIVMFLLEGDDHELALLLAYYLAKQAGWKVIYLGIRVPAADLEPILIQTKAETLFTTFTILNPAEQAKLTEFAQRNGNISILISGSKTVVESIPDYSSMKYLPSPYDFISFLEKN
ncbi:MerR family transcriptional regulator [Portibacter lacus]|uniref:HTH merR-type domain-containing protein n=1 Tax=Portibacter lacus TaxID=1099794 RepID=A0AA37SKL4_9BACT|nr:MerR family transcriptional regulator [Portibacter lacus]GLR15602.1 hypothetical protein GCM10007940_02170 [Portibacter lacus]